MIYGNFAKNVRVSVDTIRRWIDTLCNLHLGFLIRPWFLAEVKHHEKSISPALNYYQKQLDAPFAFQIVIDADYVDADCFARAGGPLVVPAKTLLSQLL